MNPISFPLIIRDYIQNNEEIVDEFALPHLFNENETARIDFIQWAGDHQFLVEHTPRLYCALSLANGTFSSKMEEEAGNVNGLALIALSYGSVQPDDISMNVEQKSNADQQTLDLINEVLTNYQTEIDEFPLNYASMAMDLLDSGIINQVKLITLFSTRDSKGRMILFDPKIFEACLPRFENMGTDCLFNLLILQSILGMTCLHNPDILELAIPLLKKLNEDKEYSGILKFLFSLLGSDTSNEMEVESEEKYYKTPLHNPIAIKKIIPFLQTLDQGHLTEIIYLKDSKGITVLEYEGNFIELVTRLDNLNLQSLAVVKCFIKSNMKPALFIKLLSRQNEKGLTSLNHRDILNAYIPFLEKQDEEFVVQFLSIKNFDGTIPLHSSEIFKKAIPLLLKLSDENLTYLFSIQDRNGDTILHRNNVFEFYLNTPQFYGKIRPEVFQIRNNENLTAMESYQVRPSLEWVGKAKPSINFVVPSEDEYKEKSQKLKQNVDTMWGAFVFGEEEGDIPSVFLELEIEDAIEEKVEIVIFTSDDIKRALDVMLERIINKVAWLGTPREDDPEGLHSFYSQMLINFEQVLTALEENSPSGKAGPLINIAKVQLEGRCATGYQTEIEQARMEEIDFKSNPEEGGLDVQFTKMAVAALLECIENITRKNNNSSHLYNQLLFAAGLALNKDPLCRVSIPTCLELIKSGWDKNFIFKRLTESFGRMGVEQLQNLFELQTPEDYGENFIVKKNELEQAEQNIVNDFKRALAQEGFGELVINNCVEMFQSTQVAGLRIGSPQRQFVSEAVFNRLQGASSTEEMEEARELLNRENEEDRNKKAKLFAKEDELKEKLIKLEKSKEKSWLEIELATVVKERQMLVQKSLGLMKEFNSLKMFAGRRIEVAELLKDELFKKTGSVLSKEELVVLILAKQQFDKAISDLADVEKVYFVPGETGLPSRSVEKLRRLDYASQYFKEVDGIQKLNHRGTGSILMHIGVFENVFA